MRANSGGPIGRVDGRVDDAQRRRRAARCAPSSRRAAAARGVGCASVRHRASPAAAPAGLHALRSRSPAHVAAASAGQRPRPVPARAPPRRRTVSTTSSDCATTSSATSAPHSAGAGAGGAARTAARRWRTWCSWGAALMAAAVFRARAAAQVRSFAHGPGVARRTLRAAAGRVPPPRIGAPRPATHSKDSTVPNNENKAAELRRAALEYHEFPTPGKLAIAATKQMVNQRDLALAYSPGVAAACEEIVADPANAFRYTSRGNLVAVITNGTAVLGLGDIGPLAAKPVMEGKAVLFKKFAGIDVFDIEVNEKRPRQAGRHHRRAGAHLRRHQPRGHQGAGLLLRRARAARADEDPGLPRRPARHRHRRRRGAAERAEGGRARTSARSSS